MRLFLALIWGLTSSLGPYIFFPSSPFPAHISLRHHLLGVNGSFGPGKVEQAQPLGPAGQHIHINFVVM